MRTPQETAEIKKFIIENQFYQKIDFGDGLVTPTGFDCEEQIELLGFDKTNFKGKTVLDVGANAGYFSHQAKLRGAKVVNGLDYRARHIPKAIQVVKYLGTPDIEFFHGNFEDEELAVKQNYDIVMMFSVFHHVKKPIKVLERLGEITNEMAMLEVRTMPKGHLREMKVVPHKVTPRSVFPTKDTFIQALKTHGGFKEVEVLGGAKTDLRLAFHAYK